MSAVPSSLRLANQAHVLEALLWQRVATRAELAKATEMSQPTAGKIVDELLSAEVVEELAIEERSGSVGRPGKQLRLACASARFVLIELGVERTRVLAAPVSPSLEERWDVEFPTPRSEAEWLAALREYAGHFCGRKSWGVVMSVPGLVDERAQRVLLCPNLHWAEADTLAARVRDLFGSRVVLLQEAQALSLGQLAEQPARTDFLLVDFGDGIGGSVMLGAKPFQGPLPFAGELGHTPIPGNGRSCGCGGRGCLETLIAEPGLLQSHRKEARNPSATFEDLVHTLEHNELPRWLSEALEATAMCLVAALHGFGLADVVLTGHVTRLPENVRAELAAAIERSVMWSRFQPVRVEFAPRRRARGLGLAAFQRLVVPTDWARENALSVVG